MNIGSQVTRNQSALKPIIGTIKSIRNVAMPYRSKPQATVHWQHTNGITTSIIALEKLVEATPENIADLQVKAKKVTPLMKSALLQWKQCIAEGEYVRFDEFRVRLGLTWDEWWRIEKAFKKLIVLGYFERHKDNTYKNTGDRMYCVAKKEE